MPSTFSTSLRLELIATGEQAGNWGTTTNNNLGTLLEQAVTGVRSVVMTDADYTLSAANGLTDEARSAVLVVTSSTLTATRALIIPNVPKTYTVFNATTGGQAITIRTSGGTGVTIPNGNIVEVYCNGAGTTAQRSAPYNPNTNRVGGGATGAGWSGTTGAFSDAVAFTLNPTVLGNALWHAGNFTPASYQLALGYTPVQQGTGVGQVTNTVKLGWSGARLKATVDATDLGNIAFDSHLAGYLPLAGGTLFGDLTTYRLASPTTGAVILGNSGARWLFWDGTNYLLGGSGAIWHTGNFNPGSYALASSLSNYATWASLGSYAPLSGAAFSGGVTATSFGSAGDMHANGHFSAGGNISASGTLTSTGLIYTASSITAESVATFLAPRGAGTGRGIVDSSFRFGPWRWVDAGLYVEVDIDGISRGINTFGSDLRLKYDVVPTESSALARIDRLDFIDFRFKPLPGAPADYAPRLNHGGVSAQQAQQIDPAWVDVMGDEQGTLMLNAPLLLTNALQGIQELHREVQALRAEVAALRA